MSWGSWIVVSMIGFTSTVAAIAISAIIVVVLSEAGTLAYRRMSAAKAKSDA